ncbi:MAG: cysteine desulfurase [Eggerthellaceae bacterium]|nr:cysteine desulfurase [Eggerthellaceae bacterium]
MAVQRLYLDYAASAPACEASLAAERAYEQSDYGGANPNSLHTPGRDAFHVMEDARFTIARTLGMRPNEAVFTGSATEADNAALFGIVAAHTTAVEGRPHVVTSLVEHPAVGQAAKTLMSLGLADVTFVEPVRTGHVRAEDVARAMNDRTVLVSVIAANNETGAVNDIEQIAHAAHDRGALFHTDAVQLLGKAPIDLSSLPVDSASFAAHKIGGPKGIGLLFLRSGTPFRPFLSGGGQEGGRRSGTQNVCAMAGFAAALEATCASADMVEQECDRLRGLRDRLYEGLCTIDGVHRSVPCESGSLRYLPGITNVYVDGFESETLVLQFDLAGIAVSGGSACSTHSLEPSGALLSMGLTRDQALGSLRVSVGRYTTKNDIERCIAECRRIVSSPKM